MEYEYEVPVIFNGTATVGKVNLDTVTQMAKITIAGVTRCELSFDTLSQLNDQIADIREYSTGGKGPIGAE